MLSILATAGGAMAADPASTIAQSELLQAADRALQGRRLIEAEALLDRLPSDIAIEDEPIAALLRAELLLLQGDHSAEALRLLAAIPAESPLACRVATARASTYLQLEAPDRASRILDPLERECGAQSVYWRLRGQAELTSGRADRARQSLQSAVAIAPADVELRNDLAVALIESDDAAGAAELLANILKVAPGRVDVALNLDHAKGMMGVMPVRGRADDDALWSRRLEAAGGGAQRSGRAALAEALYAQALVARPRYDTDLWRQYAKVSQRHD
jgi:predicted Zn-dependent protease